MTRSLLVRGMLVGLLAGVLAFVVAKLLGEGPLTAGIDFESAAETAAGGTPEPEMVSRGVQSTLGLATGTIVFGVALGGIYGLVYAIAQGRLGALGVRATAAAVAAAGFLAVYLLPALKYPSNPPGTSESDTITDRTQLYFLALLTAVIVVVGVVVLARRLAPRFGHWDAAVLAGLAGIVVLAVVYLLLPDVNETPDDFNAVELWDFRLASTAIQLTVWATLGVVFGALTERSLRSRPQRTEAVDVA